MGAVARVSTRDPADDRGTRTLDPLPGIPSPDQGKLGQGLRGVGRNRRPTRPVQSGASRSSQECHSGRVGGEGRVGKVPKNQFVTHPRVAMPPTGNPRRTRSGYGGPCHHRRWCPHCLSHMGGCEDGRVLQPLLLDGICVKGRKVDFLTRDVPARLTSRVLKDPFGLVDGFSWWRNIAQGTTAARRPGYGDSDGSGLPREAR